MNFSGKITNSVISFLQSRGADLSELYDNTELSSEFLKDTTGWMDARKMESLLQFVDAWAVQNLNIDKPIEKVGHAAKDLKSWGVLDSVLRMIERPDDIFLQPQRFISYFISPAPPIANIKRSENAITFDVPISFEEFPCVATYIRAAIEAVPLYMGAQMAEAQWAQNTISISWNQSQPLLDDSALNERRMAPEVMQSLVASLEKTELALLEKTRELESIKNENALAARSKVPNIQEFADFQNQYKKFHQQVLKLQDYFTRSQQLVTLLVGQDRQTSQIREAMKRVNWEQVQSSYPQVTREILNQLENKANDTSENDNAQDHESSRPGDSRQPWLPHN